jgi:phage head maturation protease
MASTLVDSQKELRHYRGSVVQSQGEGRVTALFTSEDVDGHNTVLLSSGCDYARYLRDNATLTWQHGADHLYGSVPIAKTESIHPTPKGLVGVFQFRKDEESQRIYKCYQDGSVRGFSVEFHHKPGGAGRPTSQEVKANPNWKDVDKVIRKWTLYGITATSFPSNPGAVALEVRSFDPVERAVLAARKQMEEWVASLNERQLEIAMEFVRAMKVPLSKPGPGFFRGPSEADKLRRLDGGPDNYDYFKRR